MLAVIAALYTFLAEAVQQAYEQGGRGERQYVPRKIIGFRVDDLGWVNEKASLRAWHLVKAHE